MHCENHKHSYIHRDAEGVGQQRHGEMPSCLTPCLDLALFASRVSKVKKKERREERRKIFMRHSILYQNSFWREMDHSFC